jgi:hypothetical protein
LERNAEKAHSSAAWVGVTLGAPYLIHHECELVSEGHDSVGVNVFWALKQSLPSVDAKWLNDLFDDLVMPSRGIIVKNYLRSRIGEGNTRKKARHPEPAVYENEIRLVPLLKSDVTVVQETGTMFVI